MIEKAVITGGVSYHHALTQPGQPLADFEPIDVHTLAQVDLERFELAVVLRSVDNEALWARRHQVARFLDAGGVLVVFGEAWTNWFPGCRWEPESAEDVLEPVVADHPLLRDITADAVHWHGKGPRWCNHGHLVPPAGAEVLVGSASGHAFLYLDRDTTNGVILAASNLDLDTHAFHGNEVAQRLLGRVLVWVEEEARGAAERRARRTPKVAGLFSGVHFQRGFFQDAEFGPSFAVLPAEELAGAELARYAALWVPRESNQAVLMRNREKLAAYLASGGTIVTFEEANQSWLEGVTWSLRLLDVQRLWRADHPLLASVEAEDVRWHSHGALAPPPGATVLVGADDGGAALYLDERTHAPGRVVAGTLDPDCHVGFGSDRPRALVRALLRWLLAEGQVGQQPAVQGTALA